MDKIIEDFNNEINIITNKLISVKGSWKNNEDEEKLLDSKAYQKLFVNLFYMLYQIMINMK